MNIDLANYYKLATKSFERCISYEENNFLSDEVDFDLSKAKIIKEKVLFEFSELDSKKYKVEIILNIFDPSGINKVGRYHYYMNQDNQEIDDKLVW